MGSASGVVNVGGFVASLLTILAIGAVLDLLTPGRVDRLLAGRLPGGLRGAVRVLGASAWSACSGTGAELRARLARDGVVLAPLHAAVRARLRGGSAYR